MQSRRTRALYLLQGVILIMKDCRQEADSTLAGTMQLGSGSTGNLPVPCGNLPHGKDGIQPRQKVRMSRSSGGLVARQHGQIARATLGFVPH